MGNSFEEMVKKWDNDTEEKRKKVLEKIKTLDSGELQVIYQSLFLMKLWKLLINCLSR